MLASSLRKLASSASSRVPSATARAASVQRQATRNLAVKFSKDHEWVDEQDGVATVGITDFAQQQLGDVVFVEVPEVGAALEKDGAMGAVESVKAASDVYAPISGEVVEVNPALADEPSLVNSAAEADGWMAKIKVTVPGELDELMVSSKRCLPPLPIFLLSCCMCHLPAHRSAPPPPQDAAAYKKFCDES